MATNPPGPGSGREYPARPILGVGGVVVEGDSVLLVKRGKDPGRGMWSIPGGAVKTGEPLSLALEREMLEEVGLKVQAGPLIEVVEKIFPGPDGRIRFHYVVLDYLCSFETGRPRPGSDAAEVRFAPEEEWDQYNLAEDAQYVLKKALKMKEELRRSA